MHRGKEDVFTFFSGHCGIDQDVLAGARAKYTADKPATRKIEISQMVCERLNSKDTAQYLEWRRRVLQQLTEWRDFSTAWDKEVDTARGVVQAIRETVGTRDHWTRIAQAEERQREERAAEGRKKVEAAARRREALERIYRDMAALWSWTDAHARGKAVERLMNELCAVEGIAVRESFHVVGDRGEGIVEQIDGVIQLDGRLFLVEIKWHSTKLGSPEVAPHLVRLFGRAEVGGLIISASGFADTAVAACREAIRERIVALAELQEILMCIERRASLEELLRAKVHAAALEKNPFVIVG